MIEVKVKLIRAESEIFATGEKVKCFIEFTNKVIDEDNVSGVLENLAWASAQIHCYRKTNYGQQQERSSDMMENGKTTLAAVTQASGDILVATKPKILFCDLELKPKETKTYFFSSFLPRDGPPTYRGYHIKYFYRLTIAMQRVKSKVHTLAIPIRVLPIPLTPRSDEVPGTEATNEELTPTNPFSEKREISELEISWHNLKNMTARRAPKFYRISSKRGFVGSFCLFKPCYKLGEDIIGSLDFSNSEVRCVQFSVKLQSQEISFHDRKSSIASGENNETISLQTIDLASIASGSTYNNLHKSLTSGRLEDGNDSEETAAKITTFSTNHEVCFAMLKTQIVIPIPLHVTPSFRTDLVELRWRIHFEFVTSTMMDFGPEKYTEEVRSPSEIPVETMVWNLPIMIYSANPLKIYSPSQEHYLFVK